MRVSGFAPGADVIEAAVCGIELVDHIHFGGLVPGIRPDVVARPSRSDPGNGGEARLTGRADIMLIAKMIVRTAGANQDAALGGARL